MRNTLLKQYCLYVIAIFCLLVFKPTINCMETAPEENNERAIILHREHKAEEQKRKAREEQKRREIEQQEQKQREEYKRRAQEEKEFAQEEQQRRAELYRKLEIREAQEKEEEQREQKRKETLKAEAKKYNISEDQAEGIKERVTKQAFAETVYTQMVIEQLLSDEKSTERLARLEGRKQAYSLLEAQQILSQRPLTEILTSGLKKGVEQGVTQVTAQLIVELTQIGIQTGVEYFYRLSPAQQKALSQQQQLEEVLTELDKNLKQYLEQVPKNSQMISTVVDAIVKLNKENNITVSTMMDIAVKLNDEEMKKEARTLLKKDEEMKKEARTLLKAYMEQTHTVLNMQKNAFEQTKAMAQQLVNS